MTAVDQDAAPPAPRVLVILLCETRAWELTAEPFRHNVLDALGADLALCVADNAREEENPFCEWATHTWRLPEPDDWSEAFEAESGGGRGWQEIVDLSQYFLGGLGTGDERTRGSGAIIMWFRRALRRCLQNDGLLDAYDWFIVTRSDYLWNTPHPSMQLLDDGCIYILDGEHYGGVTDRYAAVPRQLMRQFLMVPDPIFDEPEALAARIRSAQEETGIRVINPEWFVAFRLRELGLWNRVRWLPYIPYAVRTPTGHTSWSAGTLDASRGYYVKYRGEFIRAAAVAAVIHDAADWRVFFAPVRGIVKRTYVRVRVTCMELPWRMRGRAARVWARFVREG